MEAYLKPIDLLEVPFEGFCFDSRLEHLMKAHHILVLFLHFGFLIVPIWPLLFMVFSFSFLCKVSDQEPNDKYKNNNDNCTDTANPSLLFFLPVSQLNSIIHCSNVAVIWAELRSRY